MVQVISANPAPSDGEQTRSRPSPAGVLRFDAGACRDWLTGQVADSLGIDDSFTGDSSECTDLVAVLDEILYQLSHNAVPDVWMMSAPLESVSLWRTADSDGVDGGAVLTADLLANGEQIRLATRHQAYHDFTGDLDLRGVEVVVHALAHIASAVNREVTRWRCAMDRPLPATAEPRTTGFTEDEFAAVLNAAADDILEVCDAPDTGLRDAMNLMVNAAPEYLRRGWHSHDATAAQQRLSEVAATGYDAGLDEIIDWIQEGCQPQPLMRHSALSRPKSPPRRTLRGR